MFRPRSPDYDKISKSTGKSKKNHIIAIAIDKYSNGQLPLSYPVADCEELIRVLTERYDFDQRHVTRLYNEKATRELLRDELYDLSDKITRDDNLILLFAGHGFYNDRIDEGYWIPVDAPPIRRDREAEETFVPFQTIVKYLNPVLAHHIVLVIDSCFSGKFGQVTMKVPFTVAKTMNRPEDKPSRWVMTSGRIEEVLDQSPFAKAMREVLIENTRSRLPVHGLYEKIREEISDKIAQTAYCSEIVSGEDRGGEFFFRLRKDLSEQVLLEAKQAFDISQLREQLRYGSRTYLNYLKNGRYAKLQFERILLPDTRYELLQIDVKHEETATPLRNALNQLWVSGKAPHTLILGEGGMGKTVSCIRLWEELLDVGKEAPIPIFLPLNEYNGSILSERENRNYLYQFIAREYLDGTRLTPSLEDAFKQLFKERRESPTALLLLDGFNEITIEKGELMVELAEFRRRAQGVQMAVTSRYDMRNFAWTQDFDRLDLLPLSEGQIASYLKKNNLEVPESENLSELLYNPMMLTLYCGVSQLTKQFEGDQRVDFKPHVNSKGELLHNFIEGQLAKYLLDNANNPKQEEEFIWQAFLLRHLLPFLAHQMVDKGKFSIHSRKSLNPGFNFKTVIEDAYKYFYDIDFLDLYPLYEDHCILLGIGIEDSDFDAIEKRNRHIRFYMLTKLLLLTEEAGTYSFIHQNFRDYFAARHIQNQIQIALLREELPEVLRRGPLDYYIRQLLGELEGEHSNKMEWDDRENRWSWSTGEFFLNNHLTKLIERCRGIFDRKKLGYSVWNILTIWEEKRGELSGADLSNLDLQGYVIHRRRFSRPGLSARLTNSRIHRDSLFSQGHTSGISFVTYSPDGEQILTVSEDKTAKIWNSQTGACLMTLRGGFSGGTRAFYSRDGSHIATVPDHYFDTGVKLWNVRTGACELEMYGWENWDDADIIYDSEERPILTILDDGTIRRHDPQTGEFQVVLEGYPERSIKAYSSDGRFILTVLIDDTAEVWDITTETCFLTLHRYFDKHDNRFHAPDGSRAAVISNHDESKVEIIDLSSNSPLSTLSGHSGPIWSVTYSPDGDYILTGSSDQTAKVWDAHTGIRLLTLEGNFRSVRSLAYNSDGTLILVGSSDQTVKIWDLQTGLCLLVLHEHLGPVESVVFSSTGELILTGSTDKTAKVWNIHKGSSILTLCGHLSNIYNATFSPNEKYIFTESLDGTIKIWDANTGTCTFTLKDDPSGIIRACYSLDGSTILTLSYSRMVRLWSTKTCDCILTITGHSGKINSICYSPDGRHILTGSNDETAKVWELQKGTCILTLKGDSGSVTDAIYSPDGNRILTFSDETTIKLWDAHEGTCIFTLEGQTYEIKDITFSPDSERILALTHKETIMVWDSHTLKCIATLQGHTYWNKDQAFSPQGSLMLTVSSDEMVKVSDIEMEFCMMNIPDIASLSIQGCDFRDLHPSSTLSGADLTFLRRYGGILNDEDATRWKRILHKYFRIA